MTKRQLIDEIMGINRSAEPEFLARFSDEELNEYLEHLQVLRTPRLSGDPHRYDAYFENRAPVRLRIGTFRDGCGDEPADEEIFQEGQQMAETPVPTGARSATGPGEHNDE